MLGFRFSFHRPGGRKTGFRMASDQRWRWAGIASVIGIGGVLITDIVANVVGGYISEQIKDWQVPGEQPVASATTPTPTEATVVVARDPAPKTSMATVVAKPQPIENARAETAASRDTLPRDLGPEPGAAPLPEPQSLPAPPSQPMVLNGMVEKVIDTGTLKISGETRAPGGSRRLGLPLPRSAREIHRRAGIASSLHAERRSPYVLCKRRRPRACRAHQRRCAARRGRHREISAGGRGGAAKSSRHFPVRSYAGLLGVSP